MAAKRTGWHKQDHFYKKQILQKDQTATDVGCTELSAGTQDPAGKV